MKIGFDIQPMQYGARYAGIGYYIRNLIRHLYQLDKNNEYVLFLNDKDGVSSNGHDLGLYFMGNESIEKRYFRRLEFLGIYSWIWNKISFPMDMQRARIRLFHSNSIAEKHNIIIPSPYNKKCKVVVTVHDLIPLIFKKEHSYYWSNTIMAYDFGRKIKDLQKANAIIAVSESTRADVLKYLNVKSEKVFVTYEAVDGKFMVIKDRDVILSVKTKYKLPEKIILYVGGYYSARKNIERLLLGYARFLKKFKMREYKLVLAGAGAKLVKLNKRMKRIIGYNILRDNVILTDFIEDNDLPVLFNAAELFVYPSLHEGFGLAPLQALACGVPVVTSNNSSIPEVVGDAAILIDPYNIEQIAEAIYKGLIDSELRITLIERGLNRVKQFSWKKTAEKTLEIYSKVMNS